jgi:hypothetical protein
MKSCFDNWNLSGKGPVKRGLTAFHKILLSYAAPKQLVRLSFAAQDFDCTSIQILFALYNSIKYLFH